MKTKTTTTTTNLLTSNFPLQNMKIYPNYFFPSVSMGILIRTGCFLIQVEKHLREWKLEVIGLNAAHIVRSSSIEGLHQ